MPRLSASRDAAARYERLLEVLAVMARVSREIGPALQVEPVLRTVLAGMRSLVDCRAGRVYLRDGDELRVAASDGDVPGDPEVIPVEGTLAGEALRTGESLVCRDLTTHPGLDAAARQRAAELGVRSSLTVPLVVLGSVTGTLQVDAAEPDAFDVEDRVLLEGLATQVAGLIESARRYEAVSQLEILKSDFISRVSHELRTPITIMSGFVTTLLANGDELDAATRRDMLERIDVATARLGALVDELLTLTRLEAGVVVTDRREVELTDALEQVRRQSGRPDAVTVQCPPGTVVHADRDLLVRGIGLLVDNALKYAGGCELRATPAAVEVVDRGPGIPVADRRRVFERFTRSNVDTTVPGMGLGLPMATTLLSACGAELALEEAVDGVGTRMVARFG